MVIDGKSLWFNRSYREMSLSCDFNYWKNDITLKDYIKDTISWGKTKEITSINDNQLEQFIINLRKHIQGLLDSTQSRPPEMISWGQPSTEFGDHFGGSHKSLSTIKIHGKSYKAYVKMDGKYITVKQAEKYLTAKQKKSISSRHR